MANSTASPERSTALAPLRILICGRDGIGKTTLAADANSLVWIYPPKRSRKGGTRPRTPRTVRTAMTGKPTFHLETKETR